MRKTIIAAIGALLTLAAGAATVELSERYGYRTYRERAGGVTLLADTTLAAPGPQADYVPIAVAVGLSSVTPGASFSRESFTLIDAEGNPVTALPAREIREHYGRVAFDASLMRAQDMTIGQQFVTYLEIPSHFYGDTNGLGLFQDRVHVDPSTWFRDVIYFRRPPAGLAGILTLRVEGRGLESPVEVRFRVVDTE